MAAMIEVLLADDHALMRAGLRAMLDAQADIQVTAEAADGRDMLFQAQSAHPDVILLDISMPGLNGLEALTRLQQAAPQSAVIILSMHKVEEYVARALQAGASGYVIKDAPPQELLAAVRAAARGENYLSAPFSLHALNDYFQRLEPDPLARLTQREREVLQLLAEGHTTQSAAEILGISPKTIESHRANLMNKLAVFDIASLTRLAIRWGLVSE